ncbi:Protein scarlet [Eumeta japonica]|uniref:Protein scarlet n=1 Tax=Eumeta variegata TaxID=151549 RepID=A0A4C1UJ02_EUMVA|nr:Protein scarlet [Eumeta japonica]
MSSPIGGEGSGTRDDDSSLNPSLNNTSDSSNAGDSYELTSTVKLVEDEFERSKYEPLFLEVEEALGGVRPSSPATLVWRDLSVHVTLRGGMLKRLVNGVSGIAKPGTLVALMGPSGAGKTTLMSVLAHRSPVGTIVEGEIVMNGRPVGDFMHRESGYMHQDDLFVENLTVIEHLSIMARLRMDRRMSRVGRTRRVNQLLRQLGLYSARHTRIGGLDGYKTLSGGERKRLAFATELLTDPGLLFCDEPTTGLDSFSAQKLVSLLRASAVQGKTIICTIHQPSSELVAHFDRLVLLAEGRIAYTGTASGALNFFESLGYHCPLTYNPTDFYIKLLALTPGSESASRQAIKSVCDRFAVSDAAKELDMEIHLEFHLMNSENEAIALTAGLCFLGTARLTQEGIQDVQGALFIIIAENTFSPMYSVLNMFPEEFPLFHRELRAGLYSTPLYYIARMIALLPGLLVEPTLFTLVVYWIAGLRATFRAFSFTVFLSILVLNVAIACGSFFSCAFGSMPLAIAYLVPFDYSLMMTSGLFIKLSSIPKYLSWIRNLSWLMYSNEAMSIIQWEGVQNITCNVGRLTSTCLSTGDQVLSQYDFESDRLWDDVLALLLLYTVFHLLAVLALRHRTRRK